MTKVRSILAMVAVIFAIGSSSAAGQSIVLASTTSVESSGLLANILPQFTAKTGIAVNVVEGDPRLINRYDVIELNPQKHAGTKLAVAKILADWLVSSEGQQAIGAY